MSFLVGSADAEGVIDKEINYLNVISNPILINALMLDEFDSEVVEVTHGGDTRYYSKVILKINNLGKNRDRIELLKEFHFEFKKLDNSGILIVLCPSIKVYEEGVVRYEPVFYRGDNKKRSYTLVYCPGIVIDGSAPLMIIRDK